MSQVFWLDLGWSRRSVTGGVVDGDWDTCNVGLQVAEKEGADSPDCK